METHVEKVLNEFVIQFVAIPVETVYLGHPIQSASEAEFFDAIPGQVSEHALIVNEGHAVHKELAFTNGLVICVILLQWRAIRGPPNQLTINKVALWNKSGKLLAVL